LGGCFGTIGRFVAHQRRIELRGMRFEIEADYDPDGLLGRNPEVRPGFQEIRMRVDIDADLTEAQKQEFLEEVERRCRWRTTCCMEPGCAASWWTPLPEPARPGQCPGRQSARLRPVWCWSPR